jgi:hypothetical protein
MRILEAKYSQLKSGDLNTNLVVLNSVVMGGLSVDVMIQTQCPLQNM